MGRLLRIISTTNHWRIVIMALAVGFIGPFPTGLQVGSRAGPVPWEDHNVSLDAEVSISTDQQMDFGQIVDMDGSVTLGLADAITADPNDLHHGGAPYSGIYSITGDPDAVIEISFSSAPNNGFTLNNFITSEGNPSPTILSNLDSSGELILTIGVTLTLDGSEVVLGNGQSIGFTITSTYN
ncbi:MAG: DUF4402 domain-containing protein [Gemmatimonadales bacterium]|nr:DUF4402 domain-containing protein [Gemmatimonadales bacterium]